MKYIIQEADLIMPSLLLYQAYDYGLADTSKDFILQTVISWQVFFSSIDQTSVG